MGKIDLRKYPTATRLAETSGEDWLETIAAFKATQKVVCTALSGGRIAQTFLSTLAGQPSARRTLLGGVHFFWSDERCVPPNDPESNFRLAHEALFKPLSVPEDQVHRIVGEAPPLEACARAEAGLRHWAVSTSGMQPVLDLVLLGMGEDGHVASLFPGEPETLISNPSVFRSVTAVKPPPLRITLGYQALAAARQVWVLASGPGKRDALRESLAPEGRTPLARVFQLRSSTRIYTDIDLEGAEIS